MQGRGLVRLDGWRTECWCGAVFAGELIWHCVLCGDHPDDDDLHCPTCRATRAVVHAGGRALPAFALVRSGERLLRYKPVGAVDTAELDVGEVRQLAQDRANAAWEAALAELEVLVHPAEG